MNLLTISDIVNVTGMSRRSIDKRPIKKFVVAKIIFNGRPTNRYSEDVLKLFNININTSASHTSDNLKKTRSDCAIPRKPTGLTLDQRIDLDKKVTDLAKIKYLSQSDKFNIRGAVELACKIIVEKDNLAKGFDSVEDMIDYYYYKRLMRKDKYYVGAVYLENWRLLWESNFNLHKLNDLMPKKVWDYYSLMELEGLVGEGFGAGSMWVMDATQLDLWVSYKGKKELKSFFCILDLVTGFPLLVNPIESESVESVIQTIILCVEKYGVPRLGFILDNSRAFRSRQVQNFINLLYSQQDLEEYQSIEFIKRVFPKQSIIKYSQAKLPAFFGKAKLERAFREFNLRFTSQESRALTRKSGTEKNSINLELGTVPVQSLKLAQNFKNVFDDFQKYLYNEYVHKLRYGNLDFLIRKNIKTTVFNAWVYLGGMELKNTRKMPPDVNKAGLIYYKTHKSNKHSIKVEKLGQFRIVVNGKQTWYGGEFLDYSFLGRKITVIQNQINNGETAYCYLEWSDKYYDTRVKSEGDIYYLGEALNMIIRTNLDYSKISYRTKLQKQQEKAINTVKLVNENVREYLEFENKLKLKENRADAEETNNLIKKQNLMTENITETEETEYGFTDLENKQKDNNTNNLDYLFDFKF